MSSRVLMRVMSKRFIANDTVQQLLCAMSLQVLSQECTILQNNITSTFYFRLEYIEKSQTWCVFFKLCKLLFISLYLTARKSKGFPEIKLKNKSACFDSSTDCHTEVKWLTLPRLLCAFHLLLSPKKHMFNSQFLSKCQAVIVCPLQGRRKAHRVTHLRNLKSLYPTALSCEKTRRG